MSNWEVIKWQLRARLQSESLRQQLIEAIYDELAKVIDKDGYVMLKWQRRWLQTGQGWGLN